ncbi:hypothetical protein D7006_04020 [Xanthobacter sp. YC-JY1]|nr:hypothetical protein D7006_04020 [Xanthobacter sp. YC-JY1]
MAGLVPAIHVGPISQAFQTCSRPDHVDARDKPGHDGSPRRATHRAPRAFERLQEDPSGARRPWHRRPMRL